MVLHRRLCRTEIPATGNTMLFGILSLLPAHITVRILSLLMHYGSQPTHTSDLLLALLQVSTRVCVLSDSLMFRTACDSYYLGKRAGAARNAGRDWLP